MENLKRWQWHNRMTDPGREAIHLNGLPTEIGALCRVIQFADPFGMDGCLWLACAGLRRLARDLAAVSQD
jgi:hypothetical protein